MRLGESVARALLERPLSPLPPPDSFEGAGVYAIYYAGTFAAYRVMADVNRREPGAWPIYIGRAVPSGARKGGTALDAPAGRALFGRLRDHADSISDARNLDLADFSCRYLSVDDIWIPLGEALLIARFAPLWNTVLEGFGIHDPGIGRAGQAPSSWDVLHPGRRFAAALTGAASRTQAELVAAVEAYLANRPRGL